jgi:ABC-type transport system substrate-binding protein
VNATILPAAQVRNNEVRSTFPGLMQAGGTDFGAGSGFTTSAIGTQANGWFGPNRGGWSSPQYDRLWDAFNSTLSRSERTQTLIQMFKMISDDVPAIQLYYNPGVRAFASNLTGPTPSEYYWWNVHEWGWR